MITHFLRYGKFQEIPWSILGFRLRKEEGTKDCVKLRIRGALEGQGAKIKVKFSPVFCNGNYSMRVRQSGLTGQQTNLNDTRRHILYKLSSR